LSGAPSTGKTTLAKQIADSIAELNKIPVLFWSFEQSKEELRIKSLARIASVDTQAIAKGSMDDASWERVRKAEEYYRRECGPALTVIEAGAADTIGAIRSAALLAKHKAGGRPVLVVLEALGCCRLAHRHHPPNTKTQSPTKSVVPALTSIVRVRSKLPS